MRFFLLMSCIFLIGCPGSEMPKIDISLWAGDSDRDGITRSQESRSIGCHEHDFDQFVCLTYDDLKSIYSTILKCKKWDIKVSEENTKKFIDQNPDIHKNLFMKGRRESVISLPDLSEATPVL